MELLKRISYILFAIILVSCSTANRFNREIKRLDKANGEKYWKANQKFFSYMKDSLKDTKHIYYNIAPVYGYNTFDGWVADIFNEDKNKVYFLYYDIKDNTVEIQYELNMDSIYYSRDTVFVKEGVEVYHKDFLAKYFKDSIYVADLPHPENHEVEMNIYLNKLFKEHSCDTLKKLEKYNDLNDQPIRTYKINLDKKTENEGCYYHFLWFLHTLYWEVNKW